MRALVKAAYGMSPATVAVPSPKASEILVKVAASSLNRADLFLAEGRVHGQHGGEGTVLGLEWSGEVVEAGAKVEGFRIGDRVMCSGIGGLAEYAVADWRRCFAIPDGLASLKEAACLPVAVRTSFVSLVDLGAFGAGQSVLVLGASSAVGLMCLQMARHFGAGIILGTSTKAERRSALSEYGADKTFNSADPAWPDQVTESTGGAGVDLVIDFLAGPHMNEAMRAAKIGGTIVNVGRMAGESGQMDFDLHSMRRIRYLGQTFRTRTAAEIGAIGARIRSTLWPAIEAGKLRLPIDATFQLEQAADAFAMMKRNAHFGKIVVTP